LAADRANAGGLHLEFLVAEDGSVVCLPTIPDSFEGPAGYLHGGIIATLLDEAMSKSIRARGFDGHDPPDGDQLPSSRTL